MKHKVKFEAHGPALYYVVPPREGGSVGVCWALDDLRLPTWVGVLGAWVGRERGWSLLQLVAHTNGPGLLAGRGSMHTGFCEVGS